MTPPTRAKTAEDARARISSRIATESSGNIVETQDALGHWNPATTRVYVQRIAVNRDKFSGEVAKRMKL